MPDRDLQPELIAEVIRTMGGDEQLDPPVTVEPGKIKQLSTPELVGLAEREAADFQLPDGWKEGREPRRGLVIDAPYSPDRDDAIDLTPHSDGSYTLHVSIADVGTFLWDKPAISALAARRGWTKYAGTKISHPLIPKDISQDALSLLDGEERPVLTMHIPVASDGTRGEVVITREVLTGEAMSYEAVGEALASGRSTQSARLGQLEHVARLLFTTRHQGARAEDAVLEDEEGRMLALDPKHSAGRLIVQESMIAAGAGIAEYMEANAIPQLSRVHTPQQDADLPYELLVEQFFARYNTFPEPHTGLHLPLYTHITSPLRRFVDFANHCNLVAHFEDRELPFPRKRLEYIGGRLNRIEHARRDSDEPKVRSRVQRHIGKSVLDLAQKLDDGTANESDLAHILFSETSGSDEDKITARQQAAAYIAERIHLARVVIGIGLSRGRLGLQPTAKSNVFTLQDREGRTFTYLSYDNPRRMAVETTKLIGQIAGTAVEPQVPERMTYRKRILDDANHYLQKLHKEGRLKHRWSTTIPKQESDEITAVVTITIGDDTSTRTATAKSKKTAERRAARQLVEEFDLIDNPPEVPKPLDPRDNPIVQLQYKIEKAGGEQPTYTLEVVSQSTESVSRCAGVVTYNGKEYRTETHAKNHKLARQAAARQLKEQIEADEASEQ
jgi:dsRNA-specific ribonuclease